MGWQKPINTLQNSKSIKISPITGCNLVLKLVLLSNEIWHFN